ncbi:MAG: hypothetical protein IJ551_09415 [Prevotella sp.]|nr:hypothetical protein [Prevotella sp.]
MTNCKEFVLDDAIAITSIPITDFNLGTHEWQLTPTIPKNSFSPPLTNSVTIGLQPAAAGRPLIPIIRSTGKAKDEEDDSVAGRLHTVNVTCQIDDRDFSVLNHLLTLERTPSHLLLTFRDNTRAFVAATQDTYLCTVGRDGAKTSVQFRIQNLMGIQLMI